MDALLGHNYDYNRNLEPSASIYKIDTEKWYRLALKVRECETFSLWHH